MAKGKSVRGTRTTRNPVLPTGVRRHGSAAQSHRSGRYKFSKKGLGSSKPHQVPLAAQPNTGARFYAADDVKTPLRSHRAAPKIAKLRKTITPGTVVIILAGRFRGKRVIVLKQLQQSGLLLVSGPYKVNGVPLRRINQAYVISTSTKVDVSKVDVSKINDEFFARPAEKKSAEFFDKEKQKVAVSDARKSAQSAVDKALAPIVKATPQLAQYLGAKFTLTRGQRPHLLKF